MDLKYGFVSVDDHVLEHPEVWTSRMSRQRWGDRIPHVERQPDGNDCWVIAGHRLALPEIAVAGAENRSLHPKRWEEVPQTVYSAP